MTATPQRAERSAERPAPTYSSLSGAGREKPMYYAETRNAFGSWCPIRLAKVPNVDKRGRMIRRDSVGPKIRPMGADDDGKPSYVRKINRGHVGLSLESLHARYSPDGRLQATGKGRHDVEI